MQVNLEIKFSSEKFIKKLKYIYLTQTKKLNSQSKGKLCACFIKSNKTPKDLVN